MNGLKVEDVSVVINKDTILDRVSFELESGITTALIGHNGAGKSTMMKTLIGWQHKKAGHIILNKLSQEKDFLTYKQNISYIPEEPFLLPELTAYQHFQLYGKSYGIEEQKLTGLIDYYIKELEIADKLHEYPESLSKGMRQKVQTICALLPEVPLLLIDEPFMGLDVYAADFLQDTIRKKTSQGAMVLLTSHQLDYIQTLADRYIMLSQGRIAEQGEMNSFHELTRRSEK